MSAIHQLFINNTTVYVVHNAANKIKYAASLSLVKQFLVAQLLT